MNNITILHSIKEGKLARINEILINKHRIDRPGESRDEIDEVFREITNDRLDLRVFVPGARPVVFLHECVVRLTPTAVIGAPERQQGETCSSRWLCSKVGR
jgi:hypothetical protein